MSDSRTYGRYETVTGYSGHVHEYMVGRIIAPVIRLIPHPLFVLM